MNQKFLDHFIVLKTIGTGANSKVKAVQCPESNTLYAAKIFSNHYPHSLAVHEASIMENLQGAGIVQIIRINTSGLYRKNDGSETACCYILMELCVNGDLLDLSSTKTRLSLNLIKVIFDQILSAVSLCHSQGVFHYDLKPENILFTQDFEVKLADFGYSYRSDETPAEYRASSKFSSPESLHSGCRNGEKSDVFSLGCILFYLVCRNPPFNVADITDHHYRAFLRDTESFWKNNIQRRRNESDLISLEFRNLIEAMMNPNPDSRPNISQIRMHPWLSNQIFDLEQLRLEISNRRAEAANEIKARKETKSQSFRPMGNRGSGTLESLSLGFNEIQTKKFRNDCFLNKFTQVKSCLDKKTLFNEAKAFLLKKCGTDVNETDGYLKVNLVTEVGDLDLKVVVYEMDDGNMVNFKLTRGDNCELVSLVNEFVRLLDKL